MAMIALSCGTLYRAARLASKRKSAIHAVAPDALVNLPWVICLAVFAFGVHVNGVSAAAALQEPTCARCCAVSFGAAAGLLVVYSVVGFAGYASFGDPVQDNLAVMYPADDHLFAG